MIPILNCNRAHLYPNCVALNLKTKGNYIISNDGWEILKHCNGTRDMDNLLDYLNDIYEIERKSLLSFLSEAEALNIIVFKNEPCENNLVINGSRSASCPQAVSIELTKKCNLKCNYCYGDYKPSIKQDVMTLDTISKLLDELFEAGVTTIELTGGEPLLHPNFIEILDICYNKFLRVNILSNGVLFNDKYRL